MKRVDAEFATPGRPGRWHWAAVAVLAALSVGLSVRAVLTHLELREVKRDIHALQAQIAAAQQPAASAPVPPYDASAREMLRERDPIWIETLTALEAVGMQGVTVTAITMPAPGSPITIQLTASDYRTVLDYLSALNGPAVEPGALRFDLQQARAEGTSGQLSVTVNALRARKEVLLRP